MEEEDKEFFILVLGVLAAIVMVISWWFTTGGVAVASTRISNAQLASPDDSHGADAGSALDESADHADPVEDDAAAEADGAAGNVGAGAVDDSGSEDGGSEDSGSEDQSATDAEGSAPDEPEPTAVLVSAPSVFDAIAGRADLTVLSGLLRDEGLDSVLAGNGPFTVFAPTNDAVSSAAESDTTVTLLESARESVLTYHVVPGTYSVEELTDIARGSRSTELTTVQGEPISLALEGNNLVINGNAVVGTEPAHSSNGWVHTLDNVLIPPVAALNTLVAVEPILFASGSATIEAASFATLDQFITVLEGNSVSVTIEGHTDSSGDPILNQNLSQSRARSVLNYLVANGVDESRLTAAGFGPSEPVADNNTEEGRALNRRIEFSLD